MRTFLVLGREREPAGGVEIGVACRGQEDPRQLGRLDGRADRPDVVVVRRVELVQPGRWQRGAATAQSQGAGTDAS
jgi:hypothetical protein